MILDEVDRELEEINKKMNNTINYIPNKANTLKNEVEHLRGTVENINNTVENTVNKINEIKNIVGDNQLFGGGDSIGTTITKLFGGNGSNGTNKMYDFYIDSVLIPVSPESIKVKYGNMNKSYDLANGGEVNIVKDMGLRTISFDVVIPAFKYPYTRYQDNKFKPIGYFLDFFTKLKEEKKVFQLIISRQETNPNLFNSNMKVCLEEFSYEENAEDGQDIKCSFEFKEYVEVNTKKIEKIESNSILPNSPQAQDYIAKNTPTVENKESENVKKATIKNSRPSKNKKKKFKVKAKGTVPKDCRQGYGTYNKPYGDMVRQENVLLLDPLAKTSGKTVMPVIKKRKK